MIVIVFGLPGSGKTYLASRLALRINGVHISSDRVRKNLLSHKTYSSEDKLSVYAQMLEEMKRAMMQKKNAVLDATFYKKSLRTAFFEAAKNKDVIVFIEVKADEKIIKERLMQPREDSEADFKVYKIIQSQWEPFRGKHLILHSTDDNIKELIEKAVKYLKQDDKISN